MLWPGSPLFLWFRTLTAYQITLSFVLFSPSPCFVSIFSPAMFGFSTSTSVLFSSSLSPFPIALPLLPLTPRMTPKLLLFFSLAKWSPFHPLPFYNMIIFTTDGGFEPVLRIARAPPLGKTVPCLNTKSHTPTNNPCNFFPFKSPLSHNRT